jgi:hypothetical protein
MVDFLVASQRLVGSFFDRTSLPIERPIIGLGIPNVSKPVVFESVPHNLDVAIVKNEVIAPIWRLVGPNSHWVFIRPED